jgi:hypothetical protein
MWVLVAVVLTAVVIAGYSISDTQARAVAAQVDKTASIAQQTASMMVQVARECVKQDSAGYYATSTLMPAGFPETTPAGPGIVCVVRPGGTLATGQSTLVYLDAGATNIPTAGTLAADEAQKNMAYAVAGHLARQVAGQESTTNQLPDTIAGVVEKGSPAPTLQPTMAGKNSLDLTGLMASNFPYSTPVLASGVLSSSI